MFGEILAATNGLRVAGQIAKGLIDLKTITEVQAKAIELNGLILGAQSDLFAANAVQTSLVEEVRELKERITRMENWEAQKQRYKLAAPFPGCMVYALQKSMSGGETPHYLCASCYQRGQPSILQGKEGSHLLAGTGVAHALYRCPVCKSEAFSTWANVQPPQYFEDIKPKE
jgi:hypothetical protein